MRRSMKELDWVGGQLGLTSGDLSSDWALRLTRTWVFTASLSSKRYSHPRVRHPYFVPPRILKPPVLTIKAFELAVLAARRYASALCRAPGRVIGTATGRMLVRDVGVALLEPKTCVAVKNGGQEFVDAAAARGPRRPSAGRIRARGSSGRGCECHVLK